MLPVGLFFFSPQSISLSATGSFGSSNRWIEVEKCKKFNGMLSSHPACYFRTHKAWWLDELLCCWVFWVFWVFFFILFNLPLILHFHLITFRLVNPSKLTPHVLVIRQVLELKSELKRRSLAVSGHKNELIERLKYYRQLKVGCRNTSFPTAGGTTRSADSSPAGASHQTLHYQTFSNLQPGDGNNPVFKCKIK